MTDTTSSSNSSNSSGSSSSSGSLTTSGMKTQLGGTKKKNGHKMTCGCPICKNMKHGGSSCSNKMGGKKGKKNGHKMTCKCPICKNMAKKRGGNNGDDTFVDLEKGPDNETEASNDEYNSLDEAEKGNAGTNIVGGTRRRKRNRSRKTKKNGKKTQRNKRRGKRTNRR